jgi:hypothetical protein
MRFDLVRPCSNCPFRSDRPFHLRRERVLEILGDPSCEKRWWPAASFPCHKTIKYRGDDTVNIGPDAQQCAGVMGVLHRTNRPNDAMQLAERFGLWQPSKLDPRAPFYESIEAAIRGQFP